MTEQQYMASEITVKADQERLSDQEQTWDYISFRNLELLGVGQGWKCLEVGAGHGSITSWLAERVGSKGKVVATEIRPELHREVSEVVEIRQHDILKDELEKDYYDLVHCRMLLQHLSEPEVALARMAEAVKPGGWLMIEELDNLTMPASDSKNASADFVYKFLSNLLTTQSSETKLMDYEIGRNVHALLVNLGFTEVKSEGTSLIRYGGDLWSKSLITVWRAAYNIVANKLSTERRKTAEEAINKYIEYLNDPTFYYLTNPLCCAWGRKPKQ